ncbi:MarR family winged helix-turn-helix transcriptional regulator [Allorhizobium borbori]|uniref:DNA-binding MarR family transcriptional regulator n=1 Tax=Allorhizobium borbori TaxID=485907 RepID=A0A7W6K4B8_9HYPH|nr:MarR family transcriptional regulator [Allorhizobium borbori]MBB4104920.1 DNA-binding MarR family transcriptional regulator [Allorhizobium borbori]
MSNPQVIPFATTLHVKDTCLCLHAQRAARALARRFDAALKPFGLTNQQFSLMMALNRPEPPTIAPVASLLAMDRTTLTAALKPLERQGWVNVETDARDKRGRRLRLTDAGMAVLVAALPEWKRLHGEIEADLTAIDADSLRRGLLDISAPPKSGE